ncbi:MAG: phosphopentomutase, partial [Oscillospiraceae bacterium]|nr:phosphopentomutase [Oscillospiraceae bacterium]
CKAAREILVGEHGVGRVIARPFVGEAGAFARTANRKDFSLPPPAPTVLDALVSAGYDVIAMGKVDDIFAGQGITDRVKFSGNTDGMERLLELAERDFCGLCFCNLVDFDMLYGHRNDINGFAAALSEFDAWLPAFMAKLREDDVVIISADHGCDPGFPGTDHTREYVPLIVAGKSVPPANLGTSDSFSEIAKIIERFCLNSNE